MILCTREHTQTHTDSSNPILQLEIIVTGEGKGVGNGQWAMGNGDGEQVTHEEERRQWNIRGKGQGNEMK